MPYPWPSNTLTRCFDTPWIALDYLENQKAYRSRKQKRRAPA